MLQTYELYLRKAAEERAAFQPLTCRTAAQAMERVRQLLQQDDAVTSVEVRMAGEHLFTVER